MTFDEIVDLAVDENFEIFIDHRGDLATVKGRDAFEQRLIISLTERLHGLIGQSGVEDGSIRELAKEHIRRVAENSDNIENVVDIGATLPKDRPGVLELEVIYNTNEELTFEIEA